MISDEASRSRMSERVCEWCTMPFTPTDEAQAYCTKSHSRKACARRKKERERLQTVGKCPTPNKRAYGHENQAEAFRLPPDAELYRCPCGALHGRTRKQVAA